MNNQELVQFFQDIITNKKELYLLMQNCNNNIDQLIKFKDLEEIDLDEIDIEGIKYLSELNNNICTLISHESSWKCLSLINLIDIIKKNNHDSINKITQYINNLETYDEILIKSIDKLVTDLYLCSNYLLDTTKNKQLINSCNFLFNQTILITNLNEKFKKIKAQHDQIIKNEFELKITSEIIEKLKEMVDVYEELNNLEYASFKTLQRCKI